MAVADAIAYVCTSQDSDPMCASAWKAIIRNGIIKLLCQCVSGTRETLSFPTLSDGHVAEGEEPVASPQLLLQHAQTGPVLCSAAAF